MNAVADFMVLVGAAFIAAGLGQHSFAFDYSILRSAAVCVGVWFITAAALRHYDPASYNRTTSDDASLVTVLTFAVVTVLFLVEIVFTREYGHLGKYLLAAFPSALAVRMVLRAISQREGHVDDVLIVGMGPIGRLTGLDLASRARHRVVGYLRFDGETDRDAELIERAGAPTKIDQLGGVGDFERVLRTTPVNEVYIAGNVRKNDDEMQSCIRICERLGVPFALPASGFRLDRARPMDSHAVSDGYLHYLSVEGKPHQNMIKRLFDIAASALALWLLLPLLFVVAVLIKLTSRGPVLFRQVRTGLYGRSFHMLKFRSMVVDAEEVKHKLAALNEQTGPVFKMKNDPRTTAVGRFIRRYSIDELPQLINVLRGDMSVVGPRPPVPAEVAKYEAWQLRRLSVRPGLTCIWQVSGRSQISFEQWMYLDLQYIDNWSLAQDFSLIFKTLPAVISGRGAS